MLGTEATCHNAVPAAFTVAEASNEPVVVECFASTGLGFAAPTIN